MTAIAPSAQTAPAPKTQRRNVTSLPTPPLMYPNLHDEALHALQQWPPLPSTLPSAQQCSGVPSSPPPSPPAPEEVRSPPRAQVAAQTEPTDRGCTTDRDLCPPLATQVPGQEASIVGTAVPLHAPKPAGARAAPTNISGGFDEGEVDFSADLCLPSAANRKKLPIVDLQEPDSDC